MADFVFWGRDAGTLARALDAPAIDEGTWGWRDRSVDEIVVLGTNAERVKQELALRLPTDFRPHSHHYRALEDARASATGAASIDVGPLRLCLTFTSWGDGVFPVLAELDRDGALVAVRVQLHTEVSDAVLRALDDLPPRRGA